MNRGPVGREGRGVPFLRPRTGGPWSHDSRRGAVDSGELTTGAAVRSQAGPRSPTTRRCRSRTRDPAVAPRPPGSRACLPTARRPPANSPRTASPRTASALRPAYGQASYGQQPYGQASYGQQPYGSPPRPVRRRGCHRAAGGRPGPPGRGRAASQVGRPAVRPARTLRGAPLRAGARGHRGRTPRVRARAALPAPVGERPPRGGQLPAWPAARGGGEAVPGARAPGGPPVGPAGTLTPTAHRWTWGVCPWPCTCPWLCRWFWNPSGTT